MSDMISRKAAMELRDSLADIIGARPMSSIHSALSEYRKAITALPAQPAQGEAVAWQVMATAPRDGTWFWAETQSGQGRWVHFADRFDRYPIDHDGECWSTEPIRWRPDYPPTPPDSAELDALVDQAKGRSRFCRDRGEVKSPEIIDRLADAIIALRDKPAPAQTVQEGG